MRGRGGEVGVEGRIKRAGRSSTNGTCPKVSLHAAITLHSAPGKLIYKFRDGPRVARLLRRETEQRGSCSREAGSEGPVLMGKVVSPSRAASLCTCFLRSLLSQPQP